MINLLPSINFNELEAKSMDHSIEHIQEKFEQWRSSKKNSRENIPAPLWKSAALLTKNHSINKVAKRLRLNGQDLRKQVARYCGKNQVKTQVASNFIELICSHPMPLTECIIELSDHKGIKMRISLKDNQTLDIPGLISSFRKESR